MRPRLVPVVCVLAAVPLSACASGPPTPRERGWIGGEVADVARDAGGWGAEPGPIRADGSVIGMPANVEGESAALVTCPCDGTPLALAGLLPGDLVLALDGTPVQGARDLRDRVEALAPGSRTELTCWRAGTVTMTPLVIGRETYVSEGRVTLGLRLAPVLDLWPFDDGINLLGLVALDWDDRRCDVAGSRAAYLGDATPGVAVSGPRQEVTEFFVLPVGVSLGKRVLRQEAMP